MSRGKIHGIWVFGKFLLPLLSGGFLSEWFLRLVLPSAEYNLPSLVFLMLADGCFHPVTEVGELINGFKVDHGPLEALRKSLEELLTNHGLVNIVFSHLDHMFEICHIFVDITSLHLKGEDVAPCKVFAHVILECFGKVIDDRGPDPFVCLSSSKCHMFGDQLTCILYPCFDLGSTNVP